MPPVRRFVLAALMLAALVPAAHAQAPDWKKVSVGVEGNYPPLSRMGTDGKLSGFDIDIALALCKRMAAECTLVQQERDGMMPALALRRIRLPQMVRHAIPGFANNWLVTVKATALVSIIGLDDMVHRANMAAAATREPFTFFVLVALVYLAVTTVSIIALGLLERRFSLGVKTVSLRP